VLPRGDKKAIARAVIVLFLISASPVWAQDRAQDTAPSNHISDIIHFYQKYISPVDGQRCSMYPSCSKYAKNCAEKHGFLMGWVMGFDRLVRCGRDEVKTSSPIWINGEKYTYDPVENNDFWWSEK